MRFLILAFVLLAAGCDNPVQPFVFSGTFDLTNAPEGSASFARITLMPLGATYTLERYTREGLTKTQGSFSSTGDAISFAPFDGDPFACAIQDGRTFRCGAEVFVKPNT